MRTLIGRFFAVNLSGAFLFFLLVGTAPAATPGAAFTLSSDAAPTVFVPATEQGGSVSDVYVLTVVNSGSVATAASAPVVIHDVLPAGVTATSIQGGEVEGVGKVECVSATLTCEYLGQLGESLSLLPGETLRVDVYVSVAAGTAGPLTNSATVSGGDAATVSTISSNEVGTAQASREVGFGVERFTNEITGLNGVTDTQAGDHPFQLTNSFLLNNAYLIKPGFGLGTPPQTAGGVDGVEGEVKDVVVDEPRGFVGDPQAVPKCPQYDVSQTLDSSFYACPRASQVGEVTLYFSASVLSGPERGKLETNTSTLQTTPVFNVVPNKGYPAQFAFTAVEKIVPIYVNASAETGYAVRALVENIPAVGTVGVSTTFFGTPVKNPNLNNAAYNPSPQVAPVAFLDNPVDCAAGPQVATIYADTWENPGTWRTPGHDPEVTTGSIDSASTPLLTGPESSGWVSKTATTYPEMTGCDMLQFDPAITVQPSTTRADEPAALTIHLDVAQSEQREGLLSSPSLKDSTVTLPAGLSVSPSSADGLAGCSPSEIELSSSLAGHCPLASQLARVKITTPLLPASEPLQGHVYLATPRCNPCSSADAADGNMLRLYLEAEGSGVVIKQEGTVYANPSTGQLTTTFQNNPEVPFSDLELEFKGGLRAPLATPQTCGTFTTSSDLTPWSSPITPDSNSISQFGVDWNGDGEPCPAAIPFNPAFSAGTSNPNAGQFSPLTVNLAREDREQDIAAIQVTTPPGLSGILTGVPLCGEPQASLGTCPEASRIGTMTVAAGPGEHPLYEQGSLYLTGPYKGAPFGLSIVVPTVAGPFNLGNVVVRAKIDVNPVTTALTVTSDPIPQVIDGVPLRLRTTNVTVERPGFVFNPTNCEQLHVDATITGAQGAVEHASVPFAVSGCAGLHFGPTFKVQASGKTSKADGASLDAKVAFPTGAQSNIHTVKVDLPKQLPSRLTTLQKACTAAQFEANPAGCPAASIIGYAKASTPELPVPLIGPAYFVSHGGEAFPSLIIVLQGYGVRIDLTAATFISKAGITSSTFKTVPDAPVSSFELYLPEGPHSALAANGNLCTEASKLLMPTLFTAQDGAQFKQSTKIAVTNCPPVPARGKVKTKKKAKASSKARNAGRNRRGN
jgi:hypothetical protein